MIDTNKLLEAISTKIVKWKIEKTFETVKEANQYAGKLFMHVDGIRVLPFAGGCFTVFTWTRAK